MFDPTRELNGVFIESLATAWALFPQARVDMFAVTAAGHRHVLDAFGCYLIVLMGFDVGTPFARTLAQSNVRCLVQAFPVVSV